MESLALRYRPQTFSDVVGQELNALALQGFVDSKTVPHALLFSGVRGSGKTTSARILSTAMGSDAIEIDAASHGSVADVRELIESLKYSSGTSSRVIIYDEAHSMSKEAFNALLKTLEEPPEGVYFVLVTTEPEKIPETVKSRLIEFSFTKISAQKIKNRLSLVATAEGIKVEEPLLNLLAEKAEGSLRDALMSLDLAWRAGVSSVEVWQEMQGEADVAPEVISAMNSGDPNLMFKQVDKALQRVPDPSKLASSLVQCFKELLIVRSGGDPGFSGERLQIRKHLTLSIEPERVLAAMKILWDLKTKVRGTPDPRGNLDLAVVLIAEILTRGKQQMAPVVPEVVPEIPKPEPQRRLSLDELV